jgi:hypothetical protein
MIINYPVNVRQHNRYMDTELLTAAFVPVKP